MSALANVTNGARSQRGFTLVEVAIILLVLVILSMILLPQLGNFNRLARKVKVMEDLGAICATLKKFIDEVGVNSIWENPGGGEEMPGGVRIGVLHGPGAPPIDDTAGTGFHNVKSPADPWSVTADGTNTTVLTVETDAPGNVMTDVDFAVDRFEHHLQVNDPFFDSSTPIETRYKNTSENPDVSFFLSWKGPYFDTFTPDPWGSRYVSNVFALHSIQGSEGAEYYTSGVVCFSAGPDQQISTAFNQPMDQDPYGWLTGGDDFAVVLSAGGPF